MIRGVFLHELLAVAACAVPRLKSVEECHANPVLPYDRPLAMTATTLDGPDFSLVEYRGFAVWLQIFATWCPPCIREQPAVVAAAQKYREDGLRVIGVFSASDDTDDDVRDFRKKFAIPYPLVRDKSGLISAMQSKSDDWGYPAHLFVSPEGYLVCYRMGDMAAEEMAAKIGKVLAAVQKPLPPDPVTTRPAPED